MPLEGTGPVEIPRFLASGGETGRLIARYDWSSSLGPIADWPETLKTTVGLLVRSPVPIVLLWGVDGIMIYNDAYSKFAGSRHPELLGSKVRDGWDEVADFNDNVMNRVLAGDTLSYKDQELVLHRAERPEPVWMDLDYSPVVGDDGRPMGVIAIVVETTDRVRAETLLRENERRLHFLDGLGKATAGGVDADAILTVTTRMLGEHLDGAICAYADMEPDEDGLTIRGEWRRPGAPSLLGRYRLADFGRLAVETLSRGEPLVIEDVELQLPPQEAASFRALGVRATLCMPLVKRGRLAALMAVHAQDPRAWTAGDRAMLAEVTERSWAHIERARSEAEIRASEQRFRTVLESEVAERTAALAQSEKSIRTIFETSHQNLGLLTPEGRIVYVNATALAAIGADFAAVAGALYWETPWFSGTPGAPERVRAAVRQAAGGTAAALTLTLDLPTGQRTYDCSIRPVLDDRGAVVALVPEAVEITARLQAEEALRQAQKMEAVGQLTGGVAHDFNNLLTIIRSSIDFLRRPDLAEERRRRYMDAVSDTVERAAKLTSQLLAFARRQALRPEVFDVGERLRAVADMLDTVTGARIRVVTRLPDQPCFVRADLSQFETALVNMAVNARDAMDGEGTLTIALACGQPMPPIRGHAGAGGPFVTMVVSDEGAGIAPALLARIFEPFFTTKEVGKGTGLGLSQVIGFAKQSGGDVDVESVVGAGSTFRLFLPEVEPAHDDRAPGQPAAETPAEEARLCVLVVEDNLEVGRFATQILEDLGHATVWTHNAESALAEMERVPFRFDAVFTDVVMPGMGGIALARLLRARQPDLPVVLTSGYSHVLAQDDAHGFPLVRKPYSADQVSRALQRATARRP